MTRFRVPIWFGAFVVALGSGSTSAWASPEERCLELGANCVCSEPFDTLQSLPANTFIDPDDSPDTTECPGEGNNGRSYFSWGGGESLPETSMPPANSVSRVWTLQSPGGTVTGKTGTFANGTVCTRLYFKVSSDFPNQVYPSQYEQRLKTFEMSGTDGILQGGFHYRDNYVQYAVTRWGYDAQLVGQGDVVYLNDCRESWCRFEQCIGHSGGHAHPRARYVRVDNGKTTLFEGPRVPTPNVKNDRVWIGNLYRQNHHGGVAMVSHAMQAFWPTDEGQWIGAAYEVESGNGEPAVVGEPLPQNPPGGETENPPPVTGGGGTGGASTLTLTASIGGGSRQATAAVSDGVGPYQFLFDCDVDGHWDGILNQGNSSAQHACSSTSTHVRAWVWDQATNWIGDQTATFSTTSLGPPGKPVLVY
jgi:hypothetical protein